MVLLICAVAVGQVLSAACGRKLVMATSDQATRYREYVHAHSQQRCPAILVLQNQGSWVTAEGKFGGSRHRLRSTPSTLQWESVDYHNVLAGIAALKEYAEKHAAQEKAEVIFPETTPSSSHCDCALSQHVHACIEFAIVCGPPAARRQFERS